MSDLELHPSIVALVALSSHIASGHPDQGLCQLDKLKKYGVSDAQVDLVIDIARHIRDEAAQKLDAVFNEKYSQTKTQTVLNTITTSTNKAEACCTPTASGTPCC